MLLSDQLTVHINKELVQSSLKPCWILRHRVVLVNATVQHLRKIELRSRTGSNYAHGLSEIRDGENL